MDQMALAFLNDDTARSLNQYLRIRPPLKIEGKEPLFTPITPIGGLMVMLQDVYGLQEDSWHTEEGRCSLLLKAFGIQVPR
jgi:hypothetical protein